MIVVSKEPHPNEIIWKRTSAHTAKRFAPVHDVIFFYTKSDKYTWNPAFQPLPKETADQWYNNIEPGTGRRFNRADLTAAGVRAGESGKPWRGVDVTAKGRHWAIPRFVKGITEGLSTLDALDALDKAGRIHWPKRADGSPMLKRYLEEARGLPALDIITDVSPMNNVDSDRLGYPTQKPIELLDRIILAASNKGDIVFDPFCGCGTTIYSAHKNERRWVGCDVAILAIKLVKHTLEERYRLAERTDFEIDGIPMTVEQAQDLFRRDPFQFQHWAVEAVGGFPSTRKTGDGGIDGRLYFETKDGLRDMVISVKGGGLRPTDVRDLIGTLETEEGAELALFISLNEPSKKMREAAAKVAPYEYAGTKYEAVQFLTIADILEHKRTPHTPSKVGVKRATGQVNLPLVQKVQGEMVAE